VHRCHSGVARRRALRARVSAIPLALVSRHDRERRDPAPPRDRWANAVDCTDPMAGTAGDLVGIPPRRLPPDLGDSFRPWRRVGGDAAVFSRRCEARPALSTVRGLARTACAAAPDVPSIAPDSFAKSYSRAASLHAAFLFQNPACRSRTSHIGWITRHPDFAVHLRRGRRHRRKNFAAASLRRSAGALHQPAHHPVPGGLRALSPFNAGSWDQGRAPERSPGG